MRCDNCELRVETEKTRIYEPPCENRWDYWKHADIQNPDDFDVDRIGEVFKDEYRTEWMIRATETRCINCGNLLKVYVFKDLARNQPEEYLENSGEQQ